jgi:uncharacterized damage-inducible protein DinB
MLVYGPTQLANAFRTVRKNTVRIAEDIPEDKYDFVPAPGARSVRELLCHIAFAASFQEDVHRVKRLSTLQGYDFGAFGRETQAREGGTRSKAEIIELLETRGADFAGWLESLSPEFLAETVTDPSGQNPRSRLEMLMAAKEHEMHHRGQLMLIERMLGVVPHLTRQRLERMQARERQAAAV